jgi:hypothetical protein
MALATYWSIAPFVLIGLSGVGWGWLWFTRNQGSEHHASAAKPKRQPVHSAAVGLSAIHTSGSIEPLLSAQG